MMGFELPFGHFSCPAKDHNDRLQTLRRRQLDGGVVGGENLPILTSSGIISQVRRRALARDLSHVSACRYTLGGY
jgi:hypothetical protein